MKHRGPAGRVNALRRYGRELGTEFSSFNDQLPPELVTRGLRLALAGSRWLRPGFARCWLISKPPGSAKLRKEYIVKRTRVRLYELPDGAESLYHVEPAEYRLSRKRQDLIAKTVLDLQDQLPPGDTVLSSRKLKEFIIDFSIDHMSSRCRTGGYCLGRTRTEEQEELHYLAGIVRKYTAGFGVLEVLLEDGNVQDIFMDAPVEDHTVYVSLGFVDDPNLTSRFRTNIVMTDEAAGSMMSRFRYESGRPFSEAHPHLECDNDEFNTRVTIIGPPISPHGMAFALRRHSPEPWTLPRLISAGSLSPEAAGLISFLLDGQSTILIAGGRGAGKSSLLGAVMFEFSPVQRILTIEDTLELPGQHMQNLGYKLQCMHIRSTVGGIGTLGADEALRISLRLGESAIVLGEVRGQEARTLYEAMRAGTAGSAVLGTFHADSARSVFERVVFDMGISPEAFAATDIVIVAGLTRPSGIQKQERRVMEISELVKSADEPGTFANLLVYDPQKDGLMSTGVFQCTSERISAVARSWGVSYEFCLENIRARSRIKDIVVRHSRRTGNDELLSARWVMNCNSMFNGLFQRLYSKEGVVDNNRLIEDWKKWFRKAVVYDQ